ncbi:MAG: type I DNA topoisomerase, partial [Chloroflexi bacterium]|nr:type I DNA topoisomerase [Chloroflexota bacterium]
RISFHARLAHLRTSSLSPRSWERVGERGAALEIHNGDEARTIDADLKGARYVVSAIRQREQHRRPTAPFTTSTLQQEAGRKLHFTAKKAMQVAQQLYEGVFIGDEGSVGLITYMRTDSVQVSEQAIHDARKFIHDKYGKEFVPHVHREYKTKSKGAQEAHEAIRPTSLFREPTSIKQHLNSDQYRLYDLVWKRMIASQMHDAVFDATAVDIDANGVSGKVYIFQANGFVQKFAGFLAVYSEGKDVEEDEENEKLPALAQGEVLDLLDALDLQQKFTQPPPRYTEASLVKALEESGIGRPSTYSTIIDTITKRRGYVRKEGNALKPESIAFLVIDLLKSSFGNIVDLQFTARMEEGLDEIARGERQWVPYLQDFYGPFHGALEIANVTVEKTPEYSDEVCEKCGKRMVVKHNRFGLFLGCSGYPECRNLKRLQIKTGAKCPQDGGELVEKRSKKGKRFYSCENYPACTFAMNLKPIQAECPQCHSPVLGLFPRGGVACPKCDYKGRRPKVEKKQDGVTTPAAAPEPVGASSPSS